MTKYLVTRNRDGSYKLTHRWTTLSVNLPDKKKATVRAAHVKLLEMVKNHNV